MRLRGSEVIHGALTVDFTLLVFVGACLLADSQYEWQNLLVISLLSFNESTKVQSDFPTSSLNLLFKFANSL